MADTMITPQNRGQITNPYDAEHRAEYKMGGIEKFLHDTLGFRTGYDTYHENMDNASAAWLAQQENNSYEEAYNSPEAQAARMRAAGLNPDIAPSQIEPGQATEFTEPESMPESPTGIDIDAFSSACEISSKIAALALDAVTGSAGLFTTITGGAINLTEGINKLDEQELVIGEKLREMANESYGELEKIASDFNELGGGQNWGAKITAGAGDFLAKARGLSGRNKKKFAKMYNSMAKSATAKMKTLEKEGKLTELEANPKIAAPYLYKEIEMSKAKHDAQIYEILLNKAQLESQVLKDNPELFKGMTTAQMRQKINEAVMSGNQAEINKYDKAIKELDKLDRETEQKQRDIDREYIKNFKFGSNLLVGGNTLEDLENYRNAMERLYGKTPSYGVRALVGM